MNITINTGNKPSDRLNVLIGGDYFPRFGHTEESLLSPPIRDLILNASIASVNLEAPVQSTADSLPKYGPSLSLPHSSVDALAEVGFDLVQLANNHIMDFGDSGLRCTLDLCGEAELRWVGVGMNSTTAIEPVVLRKNGVDISILNAGDREFGTATQADPGYAWIGDPRFPRAITDASRESDIVIVILHGGVELEPIPATQRRELYHRFADAGADVILGHHPHVPRGWEVYKETPICYSLGHFLFDFPLKYRKPKTEWGLLADIQIDGGNVRELVLRPIEQHRHRPRVRLLSGESDRIDYLRRCETVLSDPVASAALWQQLAVKRYNEYYGKRFNRSWLAKLRTEKNCYMRWLQNVNQCEAHSWCIQTGTGVLSGSCEDVRRPDDRKRLSFLRNFTRDETIVKIKRRIKYTMKHLAE